MVAPWTMKLMASITITISRAKPVWPSRRGGGGIFINDMRLARRAPGGFERDLVVIVKLLGADERQRVLILVKLEDHAHYVIARIIGRAGGQQVGPGVIRDLKQECVGQARAD